MAPRLLLTTIFPFTSVVSDPIPSSNPSSNQTGSDWPIGAQPSVIARPSPANERPGRFGGGETCSRLAESWGRGDTLGGTEV